MFIHPRKMGPITCRNARCQVPPSPELLLELYVRYKGLVEQGRLPKALSFKDYLSVWAASRRGEDVGGLDDGKIKHGAHDEPQLIDRPPHELKGTIRTLVLLVDFPDRPHRGDRSVSYYEQMLFGTLDVFPTGSMAEYYRKISNFNNSGGATGIDVQGSVHGWFRLPQTSDYYTSGSSGMGNYPRNVQGMAQDAVRVAMSNGLQVDRSYDVFGEGDVTALFIVHAGRGAEQSGSKDDIWSLKWLLQEPPQLGGGLNANAFLTVPEDCQMGVCAHEWGHLAGRWADFYDTGRDETWRSNGLGNYCLMASGSWNNGGITPGLPNGMLRMFHKWIEPIYVTQSTDHIELRPAAEGGSIALINNPRTMKRKQYVFAEYRRRGGQDLFLTDEGVAIYTVDEAVDNVNDEDNLAIELIQADSRYDLSKVFSLGNRGDESDLYPTRLPDGTLNDGVGPGTNPPLPGQSGKWSGVEIKVHGAPGEPSMFIDVRFD
jgi:immune inhibitor A